MLRNLKLVTGFLIFTFLFAGCKGSNSGSELGTSQPLSNSRADGAESDVRSSSPLLQGNDSLDTNSLKDDPQLRCVKPFILMDEDDNAGLRVHLERNLLCLDDGEYQGRNYLTFALEQGKTDSLKVLLSIAGDSKGLSRFYQSDARKESLFTIISKKATDYTSFLRMVYGMGLKTQIGEKGENLADLAWLARDAALTADLFFNDKIRARNKSFYEYVVHATADGFTQFVIEYVKRSSLDLATRFKYQSDQKETLLEISTRDQIAKKRLDLGIVEFYLQQNAVLEDGHLNHFFMVDLRKLRSAVSNERASVKAVDDLHLRLAKQFPDAWSYFVDRWLGVNPELEAMLKSLVEQRTSDLNETLDIILPRLPALVTSLSADLLLKNASEKTFQPLLAYLKGRNRLPTSAGLNPFIYRKQVGSLASKVLAAAATQVYIQAVKEGFYPVPTCSSFFNPNSVSVDINDAQTLLGLGMEPKSCVEILSWLPEYTDDTMFQKTVFFYQVSGSNQPTRLSRAVASAISYGSETWVQKFFDLGYQPTENDFKSVLLPYRLYFLSRTQNLRILFASHLDQLKDSAVQAWGCDVMKASAVHDSREVLNAIIPAFIARHASFGQSCSPLLVYAVGKLSEKAVSTLLAAGASVHEETAVMAYFSMDPQDYYDRAHPIWNIPPVFALSSYLFKRDPADAPAVRRIADQLLKAGANPSQYRDISIGEFHPMVVANSYYSIGARTNLMGAAIFSGDEDLVDYLEKAGVHWPTQTLIFGAKGHNVQKPELRMTLNTPASLQYLAALRVEARIVPHWLKRPGQDALDYEKPRELMSLFSMLKFLIAKTGPDKRSYTIFPIPGRICPIFTGYEYDCGGSHESQVVFDGEPITLMKWVSMRAAAINSKRMPKYSTQSESFQMKEAILSYVSTIEAAGGDARDFYTPTAEAYYRWR